MLPISIVITLAFIPMGTIFCREIKEIMEIRRQEKLERNLIALQSLQEETTTTVN